MSTRKKRTTEPPAQRSGKEASTSAAPALNNERKSTLMGRIKASLAEISTEFKPVEPDIYVLEIDKVEEVEKNGETTAYRISNKVVSAASGSEEMVGRKISDFINILSKDGSINEYGLQNLKRYFEAAFGKEEVATWTDDDYDTERLPGRQFRAQVAIESYTKEGETEPRQKNVFKRIESLA